VPSYSVGADAGLAEYTSGGYVSDDTIFLGFALPRRESLGPAVFDPPADTPGARRYFPKTTDGDTVSHFVAEGALYERLLFRGQLVGGFMLDDKVYEDYAARLIPRAVGYSAGLLNYFFRSSFDFTVGVSGNDASARLLTISIPPELTAETMDGTFTLYAEDKDGLRSAVAGASITTTLFRGASAQAIFAPVSGVRAYVLVFRGTLGAESDAVTGRSGDGPVRRRVANDGRVLPRSGARDRDGGRQRVDALIVMETRRRTRQQRHGFVLFVHGMIPAASRRVSLEFDPRIVGATPVRLLLDDTDVGVAWSRGQTLGIPADGRSESTCRCSLAGWDPRAERPAVLGRRDPGGRRSGPARLVAQRVLGQRGPGSPESVTGCPLELQCEQLVSNSTVLYGLVFFGDGNGEGRDTTASASVSP
jgi:hypothetical protein